MDSVLKRPRLDSETVDQQNYRLSHSQKKAQEQHAVGVVKSIFRYFQNRREAGADFDEDVFRHEVERQVKAHGVAPYYQEPVKDLVIEMYTSGRSV